jgi:hypothetical protein
MGREVRAGQTYSPAGWGTTTNPPAVQIAAPTNGAVFHAHEDISLRALATPHGTSLAPDANATRRYADTNQWSLTMSDRDAVTVEFLAGTNHLGSRTSGLVSAGMRPQPGRPVPQFRILVGYPLVELSWSNAPAGSYTLMARATNIDGLASVSAPVNITVLP